MLVSVIYYLSTTHTYMVHANHSEKIFYLQLISQPLTLNNFDHLVSGNSKGQENSHDSLEIEARVHCKYLNCYGKHFESLLSSI